MIRKTMMAGMMSTILCLAMIPTASAVKPVADSVSGFSNTQGTNGWYYGYSTQVPWGYYDGNFSLMTSYATPENPTLNTGHRINCWYGTPDESWAGIQAGSMGPAENIRCVIHRWVSDISGPVDITLSFQHDNNITGFAYDGVHGYVYVDGQEVWHQYAAADDMNIYTATLSDVTLAVGSKVDFLIYSGNWNCANGDGCNYTATISSVTKAPEFSPSGPYIFGPTDVTLSSQTEGASIYYTLNGDTPTTDSVLYTTGSTITVADGDTLQTIAVAEGCRDSAVTSVTFEYNPARADLTRGHYLLIEKGLQIQALTFPQSGDEIIFSMDRFKESNFTGVNFWALYLDATWFGDKSAPQWGRWCSTNHAGDSLSDVELGYLNQMVSFQYMDEQNITNSDNITAAANWMALNKERYPDVISHTNQYGGQFTFAELQNYVLATQPDMVMFDTYPFNGLLLGGSPTDWYLHMQKYRQLGLAGLKGDGSKPVPYALYLQTYIEEGRMQHVVSDSELRLNQFAAWAFGFKFAETFLYINSDGGLQSVLFNGIGDLSPTSAFYEMAEINRQSRNLGPSLIRLISKDVRMMMGQHKIVFLTVANTTPSGITTGLSGADDYMTGATATNLGSKNNGLSGDVVIGFFKPLDEAFDGNFYSNQTYFMVTNGLTDGSASGSETQQTIRLTFNFGSSGINSLQRLSRDTGAVETVSLVSDGNGVYHLDLTLDGGTGDLFKYNTGAPFVGFYTAEKISGDANSDGVVDVGDLGILAANYGQSNKGWSQGDFNHDGKVDVGDLGVLAANYGTGSSNNADFNADYAKVFGTSIDSDKLVEDAEEEETASTICSSLGLSLVAGLAILGLMLVKLKD